MVEFLTNLFNKGVKDKGQRVNGDQAYQLLKNEVINNRGIYTIDDYKTVKQINSFFSTLGNKRLLSAEPIKVNKQKTKTNTSLEDVEDTTYLCLECMTTDLYTNWIQCDECPSWVHAECVGILSEPVNFLCNSCAV